jgi:hypothetical protein
MNRRKFFASTALAAIAAALGLKSATTLGDKVAYVDLSGQNVSDVPTVYHWQHDGGETIDMPGYRYTYVYQTAAEFPSFTEEELKPVVGNLRLMRQRLISMNFQNPELKAVSDAYCQSSLDKILTYRLISNWKSHPYHHTVTVGSRS